MKKIILHNPTDKDIVDYRIAEAKLDGDGNPTWETSTGTYKGTGVTLEWSLLAGETKSFPAYVADYLKEIYGFLEAKDEVVTEASKDVEKTVEPVVEAQATTGNMNCPLCGMHFRNEKGLGLHMGHRHLDNILNNVKNG